MSSPVGDLKRIVALLTAIEGDNHSAIDELLREFTQSDVLRMGAMYVESIRDQANAWHVGHPPSMEGVVAIAAAIRNLDEPRRLA